MKSPESPTDWSLYDVPTIAAMLDEDYETAWDQVMAWRYAHETISEHRVLLARARTELAEGWPPEQSIASARYFETIDGLDRSLADTSDAAIRNSNALADVLTALSEAKASIGWLHESWETNKIAPALYSQAPGQTGLAINAALMMNLNAQAHEIMTETDQVIFENTRQLTPPVTFQLRNYGGDFSPVTTSSIDGITAQNYAPPEDPLTGKSPAKLAIPKTSPASLSRRNPASGLIGDTGPDSTKIDELGGAIIGGLAGTTFLTAKGSQQMLAREVIPNGFDRSNTDTVGKASASSLTAKTGPQVSSEVQLGSQTEASGMLAPNTSVPLQSAAPKRRRRRSEAENWQMPEGVPGLLIPRPDEPIYHDPGPGVIGLTR